MVKNRKLWMGILILSIIVLVTSCGTELLCKPVVASTGTNYTDYPPDLPPFGEIWTEFSENYSGEDLAISLRNSIIQDMKEQSEDLGEDPELLQQCIIVTYDDWYARPTRIPCYAEKCMYENESIWAIAFNRANDFRDEPIDHIDVFFVSCVSYEILFWDGCF